MTNSFIFDAFQATTGWRGYRGDLARFIDKLNVNGDDIESFELMFEDSLLIAGETEVFAPNAVIGHLQTVMNKVCWNARKLFMANNKDSVTYGDDPAEQTVEDTGVSLTNDHITAQVDDDYNALLQIQSSLLELLDDDGYMSPLCYFSEDERQPNGDWVTVVSAQSFDDAFTHMDAVSERLKPADDAKKAGLAERIAARRAARAAA